jgi:integrase
MTPNPAPPVDPQQLAGTIAALVHQLGKDTIPVRQIVEDYLRVTRDTIAERTYLNARDVLYGFVKAHGDRATGDCSVVVLADWIAAHPQWKSAWTRKRGAGTVKRCFSWAHQAGIIRRNPFAGAVYSAGEHGRPMTDQECRIILRNSEPAHRRLLLALKWTGARPSELTSLCWCNVDLERRVIVLPRHKTAKKTGRPRVIAINDKLLALLRWIREHPRGRRSARLWLKELLAKGPRSRSEVNRRARLAGYKYTEMDWAREVLGVETFKKGESKERRDYYRLPRTAPEAQPEPRHTDPDRHVFLNSRGGAFTRNALACWTGRVKRRTGLALDCRLYGLRHAYGTAAVATGINLKICAELMGHVTTRMMDIYAGHVGEDYDLLVREAARINL